MLRASLETATLRDVPLLHTVAAGSLRCVSAAAAGCGGRPGHTSAARRTSCAPEQLHVEAAAHAHQRSAAHQADIPVAGIAAHQDTFQQGGGLLMAGTAQPAGVNQHLQEVWRAARSATQHSSLALCGRWELLAHLRHSAVQRRGSAGAAGQPAASASGSGAPPALRLSRRWRHTPQPSFADVVCATTLQAAGAVASDL